MTAGARVDFEKRDSTDFAYSVEGVARFRVNVFRHLGGMGAVFRAIPSQAKTLKDLDLPPVLSSLAKQPQGMILVTGKTGSGKSTTLAAIIDEINNRVPGHIVTIEDPIEFVHQRKKCLISQREVGHHTPSFAAALTSALREDPDVILVGEMRDLETISIAVTAAEMGILVMGTLHTNGAAQTVDRIVNSFPTDKQSHVRTMLSTSLRGVISQQLVPRKGAAGPGSRARDHGEHAGGRQPDPAGQARPAGERHAGRPTDGHEDDGQLAARAVRQGRDHRPCQPTNARWTRRSSRTSRTSPAESIASRREPCMSLKAVAPQPRAGV